jgi:hypothetical protein
MTKMYDGDMGTILRIDCGSDVTAALSHELRMSLPDGSTAEWSTNLSAGLPNCIEHVCAAGELKAGRYKGQAFISLPSWTGLGETFEFIVYTTFK